MMRPGENEYKEEDDTELEKPKSSSALYKRPSPKLIDDSEGPSYILPGIQLSDPLMQNKPHFNGWQTDPEAVLVVEGLGQGQEFAESDFSGVDFSGAALSFINLSGADLKNANLAGADLRGADLSGADLRGVNLESANLEGANLEGALFDGAYLKNAVIAGVKLSKHALNELEKMQQLQHEAEEGNLDLRQVNLKYLDLRRLDLRGVNLTGIDLSGVNLVGVNLTGAMVDPMYLDGSYAFRQMPGRTLDIKKGSLAGADLTTANLLRARQEELDILRRKRLETREAGQNAAVEQVRNEEMMHRRETLSQKDRTSRLMREAALQMKQTVKQEMQPDVRKEYAPERENKSFQEYIDSVPAEQTAAHEASAAEAKTYDEELELLKSRRQQQLSPEEMKANLQDVILLNPLENKARSVVINRPPRKEMLPPSKYDFPVLYKDADEESTPASKTMTTFKEVSKVAEQVTYHVKKAFRKIMPRRSRIRRQRQRS